MKAQENISAIDIDKINLLQVKVFKAHLEAENEFRDNPKPIHEYVVETATDSAFDFAKKLCRFRLFLKFSAIDKEKNQLGLEAEYGIEFHYYIDNLNEYLVQTEGNDARINSILGVTLCGISYSTARGIVLERMQGTYFDGVILPVVNANQILHEEKDAEK